MTNIDVSYFITGVLVGLVLSMVLNISVKRSKGLQWLLKQIEKSRW